MSDSLSGCAPKRLWDRTIGLRRDRLKVVGKTEYMPTLLRPREQEIADERAVDEEFL